MVAMKSRLLGMLIATSGLLGLGAEVTRAGGIISAGSSGTLYYGNRGYISNYPGAGAGSAVLRGGSVPVATFVAPAPPAAKLAVPFATPAQVPPSYSPPQAFTTPAVVTPPPADSPAANFAAQFTGTTSTSVTFPPVSTPNPTTQYDAFINFGTAPYLDQALLTTGTAQSWTNSPALFNAFGRTPSATELNNFSQNVLAKVESTYANSGLSIRATTDPNASAAHTLSVVSGLSASTSADAVGVTKVGYNGFSFIDKLGYANSPDQLEWAVAHNVAHELMHSFGGSHHTTVEGNNLDASRSDWAIMVDPNTKFSAESVAEMTKNIREGGLFAKYGIGAEGMGFEIDGQELNIQPVPEPATFVLWGAAAGIAVLARRRMSSRRAA